MSSRSNEFNNHGVISGNVNVGTGNVINSRDTDNRTTQKQTFHGLTPQDLQLLQQLAEATEDLLLRLDLVETEQSEILTSVKTLRQQTQSPDDEVPGFRRALERIVGLVRRFPEQAAASTAGSLAATAIVDQLSGLLGA